MKCRLCGAEPYKVSGGAYLQRVNEKGIEGVWECRPCCGADLPQETLIVMALDQAIDEARKHHE